MEILAHLWQLTLGIMDDAAPVLEGLGVAPKGYFLLLTVEEHPFPAELARAMHLPPPTVTYLVKQLESKGFLKREAEPTDLRKFRLVLTPAGRKAVAQGQVAITAALGKRLARIDPKDVAIFDGLVRRLAQPDVGSK